MFAIDYQQNWGKFFSKLDKNEQLIIWKKIQQLKTLKETRHLKYGLPYFVLDSGQYRICYEQIEKIRRVMFAGNHKQYEKWLKIQ
ncbi:MAG: hypothetical protein NUV57_05030 [archaeon]|nr:hypothetical protein [archaeon]